MISPSLEICSIWFVFLISPALLLRRWEKEEKNWRRKIFFCEEEGKGENYFFAEENNNGEGTVGIYLEKDFFVEEKNGEGRGGKC